VQCRADDEETLSLLSVLEDAPTRAAVTAERQFLLGLGGGCAVPVAAYAEVSRETLDISITGLVASLDGKQIIKVSGSDNEPIKLGKQLAQEAIAQGANEILTLSTEG
jgi:hydroxymethylbilane synthase